MLIEVIYEIYDGLPLITKALQITMPSPAAAAAAAPMHPFGNSSAVRGWTSSPAGAVTEAPDGAVLSVRTETYTLEDAIEIHAFVPLEALACV